jgi:pimeloyl-ACP methyl ester carboxylesterase
MSKNFHENIKCSVLYVYASPPAYGDTYFNSTMDFFINLKNSKVTGNVEIVKIDGSHHFHMIQPEQTKSIIIDFLNSSLKN